MDQEELDEAATTPEVTSMIDARSLRRAAFQMEADPLFFKVNREEADYSEWIAKIAEIRARFPYPET